MYVHYKTFDFPRQWDHSWRKSVRGKSSQRMLEFLYHNKRILSFYNVMKPMIMIIYNIFYFLFIFISIIILSITQYTSDGRRNSYCSQFLVILKHFASQDSETIREGNLWEGRAVRECTLSIVKVCSLSYKIIFFQL